MIVLPSQHSPLPLASGLGHTSSTVSTTRRSKVLTQADIQQASKVPDRYCGRDNYIRVDTKKLLCLLDLGSRGGLHVLVPELARDSVVFSFV